MDPAALGSCIIDYKSQNHALGVKKLGISAQQAAMIARHLLIRVKWIERPCSRAWDEAAAACLWMYWSMGPMRAAVGLMRAEKNFFVIWEVGNQQTMHRHYLSSEMQVDLRCWVEDWILQW